MSLNIKHLHVAYEQTKVLEDINLQLLNGEIGIVVGLSGGGKSTLLKTIAGLNKNAHGTITLNNEAIIPTRHRIGYIPQKFGLVPWFNVKKNVQLPAIYRHIDCSESYRCMMEDLGILDLEKKYPYFLSGGQQQRVAIARALLLKPNLLLMDEPFSSLDPFTKQEARKMFLKVWQQEKVTTLIVSHDIREAIFLGHKIIILSHVPGRIVEVLKNPFYHQWIKRETVEYKDLESKIYEKIRGEQSAF